MLGNGRLEALCFDGEKRLAHIRGKLRKKVWINQGDIILLSLRDYQDEKGDVILKYSADEARSLKAYGELPESAKINETDTYVAFYFLPCFYLECWYEVCGGYSGEGQQSYGQSETMLNRDIELTSIFSYRYGHEGVDDNVEFDEDRDGSSDDKDIDVDEI